MANALNRNEINTLRAENESFKKESINPRNDKEPSLTDDEIRQKIVEADKNPNNFAFQRNLGLALFSYGAMKQDVNLISESTRLLQRTYNNNPKDYDVIVTLGNAFYDIASIKKDNESFNKSREFYLKALEQKPDDSNVRADFGSTFLFAEPNDLDKAITELQKALEINPKNERALLFMTQTLLKQNKKEEAEKVLAKLKEINPKTPNLNELNSRISQDSNTIQQ